MIFTQRIIDNAKILELVLTTIAIIVALFLFGQTKQQVKASRDAIDTSAYYSSKAIESANRSIDSASTYNRNALALADSSMRIDNRAYVTVDAIVMDTPRPRNDKWQVDIWFINSWKTPAQHVRGLARCDTSLWIYDKEILAIRQAIHRSSSDTISDMLVGPNQRVKINPTYLGVNPRSNNWLQILDSAKVAVFVYGYAEYVDIFKDRHYLEFCQRYWPKRLFVAYKEHNNEN